MVLTETLLHLKEQHIELMQTTLSKAEKLYGDFASEVEKHSNSPYSLPNITKAVAEPHTLAAHAVKLITEACFESQKLSNLYYVIFGPKLTELYHDASQLQSILKHNFMIEPSTQAIKTDAGKTRAYEEFAFETTLTFQSIRNLKDRFYYLGKYTESLVYELNRLLTTIESMDKLQSKSLWVDSVANDISFDIIQNADHLAPQPTDDFDEL